MKARLLTALVASAAAFALTLAPAGADPTKGERFELMCDNGRTYSVVVAPGNGAFTPAFDTNSNAVLIPVSFGEFTGVIRDGAGNVVAEFTEPGGDSKGGRRKGLRNPVTCTFSFTEVSDGSDPEFPLGFSFTGSGTVVGRVTPGR